MNDVNFVGTADLGGRVAEVQVLGPVGIRTEGLQGLWLVQGHKAKLPITVWALSLALAIILCTRLAACVPAAYVTRLA